MIEVKDKKVTLFTRRNISYQNLGIFTSNKQMTKEEPPQATCKAVQVSWQTVERVD